MELRILRYFLAVAREENITKAAELLHITQPTLSRQLAQLEEDMGVTLFSRGARKVTLTDEGMLLRRRAEEIVDLADKTEKELTERDELINGVVSVGCGELASVQVIAEMFRAFKEKYPAVTYELYAGNADYTNERIEKGLSDIALFLEPVDIDRYDFIRLGVKERWAVLLPAEDPLVQKGFVTAADLVGKELLFPARLKVQNELVSWFGDYFPQVRWRISLALASCLRSVRSLMEVMPASRKMPKKVSKNFLRSSADVSRTHCFKVRSVCWLSGLVSETVTKL